MFRLILVAVVGFTAAVSAQVRVEVSRDTWVSAVRQEAAGNNGGSSRLKTKSIQEMTLLDLDPAPLRGRVAAAATLHLRAASADPQRRLTVSTLPADWVEGTASGYAVQKGSASFLFARHDELPWAYPGGDLTDVINGMGNSTWAFADATPPDADGWQAVAVHPRILAARIAGISQGFVVMDDVGSEYERHGERFTYRPFPNRFFYSRDSNRASAPYFTVTLGPEDRQAPAAVAEIQLHQEQQEVRWITPADAGPAGTIGFVARCMEGDGPGDWERAKPLPQYLVPMAGNAGQPVAMRLRDLPSKAPRLTLGIRPVDAAGNVGPARWATIAVPAPAKAVELPAAPAKLFDATSVTTSVGGVDVAIIDALDKIHPVTGELIPAHPADYLRANHIWSSQQKVVRLHAARNETVDFQVVLSGKAADARVALVFDDARLRPALFRFRHVNTSHGPLPDPLVPLTGAISIPAADESIDAQKHAAILAEAHVPADLPPGDYRGTLTVAIGRESLAIAVTLHAWDFRLPDRLSFIPEMNCYGLPANEIDYYRLAHAHRTCLNRLGYNWRGQVNEGCAPTWDGKAFDFGDYDRRFGPLLDGSAFEGLPRGRVPVEAFYLPLNENWPVSIEKGFRGGYWADEALTDEYNRAFTDACRQFAAHIVQKGWRDTFFEFYLNNKVYNKKDAWSRSSAPWIFDEPTHTQDFWALRHFGILFHTGVAPFQAQAKLAYRCDISRPQWQRDLLDGVLDVNVVGGAFQHYSRRVIDRKQACGELVINYGSSNAIDQSNVQPAAWCIDAWTLGADGVLPWQTVGRDTSWKEADELALFYPGGPAGSRRPLPSVRLKSYRRGQQDVEYLALLAAAGDHPRSAVADAARSALRLRGEFRQAWSEDAGHVDYRTVDPAALWSLRQRVAAALDGRRIPRDQPTLRTPPRDPASLPALGRVAR